MQRLAFKYFESFLSWRVATAIAFDFGCPKRACLPVFPIRFQFVRFSNMFQIAAGTSSCCERLKEFVLVSKAELHYLLYCVPQNQVCHEATGVDSLCISTQ
jgi:hypothetical protein